MKKFISLLLSVVMLFSITAGIDLSAYAAGNSIATATNISLATSYSGYITETNEKDVYKFTLSTSGRIAISLTAYVQTLSFYVYNIDGETVWDNTYVYWNDNTQQISLTPSIDLTSGTYYFAIVRSYPDRTGSYSFKISFSSAGESFKETKSGTNNSVASASSIALGNSYKGQLALNDERDVYKFTLSTSGRIAISLTAYVQTLSFYIYNIDGETVWDNTYVYWNDNTQQISLTPSIDLTSGIYYFAIVRPYADRTGNYNLKISFSSAGESFKESKSGTNNSVASASSIALGNSYKGQLALNDERDLYKFSLNSSTKIKISLTAYIQTLSFYIYDLNGNTIWDSTYQYWDDNTHKIVLSTTLDLSGGTYYFAIVRAYGDRTGNYNFNVDRVITVSKPSSLKVSSRKTTSLKLSWGKVSGVSGYELQQYKSNKWTTIKTTTSTSYTVSKLKAGTTYKFRVRAYKTVGGKKYYSSWKTLTACTKPSTLTISSLKSNKSKQITVKWKKATCTGYQIQYSTSSKFTSGTTKTVTVSKSSTVSKTISKLKSNKKYYVRIRAYKTVNGTKYYGTWSKAKSVTTKK